jgi:peptidoglycan biosynthesis protein MviN/MurJ (putative lipid II flippase)
MYLCEYIGLGGYQGASVATLITQIIPCIFLLIYLKKYLKLNYKTTINNSIKITLGTSIMYICMLILSLIYPLNTVTRLSSIIQVIIYTCIGGTIYMFMMHKSGVLKQLFGTNLLKKFYKTHQ